MITVRNQFEGVPAFEHIAGSSFGNWSNRETACALLSTLEKVSDYDCSKFYIDIAELHDESDQWFDFQDEIAELLNEYMPMPEFCSVVLEDNEFTVRPNLEAAQDDCHTFNDYPDKKIPDSHSDFILVVNDHGNVTCQQWDYGKSEYITIWDMV